MKNDTGGRATAHMKYLLREGVGKDGEAPETFGRDPLDAPDANGFVDRCSDDRHHFRVILSPENSTELDLEDYTREVVLRMEKDLGTSLDWVAVAHHNTHQPHVHVVIRGVDEKSEDLFITPDYITTGMRRAASEVATHHLGPRTEHDVADALRRSINAPQMTPLDYAILRAATPSERHPGHSRYDVSSRVGGRDVPSENALSSAEKNALVRERLHYLHALGVITPVFVQPSETPERMRRETPNEWYVPDDLSKRIRNRAKEEAAKARLNEASRPLGHIDSTRAMVALVVERGFKDDVSQGEYLILDSLDGQSYYVDTDSLSVSRIDAEQRLGVGDVVAIEGLELSKSVSRSTSTTSKTVSQNASDTLKRVSKRALETYKTVSQRVSEASKTVSASAPGASKTVSVSTPDAPISVSASTPDTPKPVSVSTPAASKSVSSSTPEASKTFASSVSETLKTASKKASDTFNQASQVASKPSISASANARKAPPKRRSVSRLASGSVEATVTYDGPTWLDRELVSPLPQSSQRRSKGFGATYERALEARKHLLIERGVISSEDPVPADLVKRLRERERIAYQAQVAETLRKDSVPLSTRAPFEGVLRERVTLPGGRYAVIENDSSFTLIRADKHLNAFEKGDPIRVKLAQNAEGRLRQYIDSAPKRGQTNNER